MLLQESRALVLLFQPQSFAKLHLNPEFVVKSLSALGFACRRNLLGFVHEQPGPASGWGLSGFFKTSLQTSFRLLSPFTGGQKIVGKRIKHENSGRAE